MRDMLLVVGVDEGYAQSIARKLRGEGYSCQLVPPDSSAIQMQKLNASGLILAAVTQKTEAMDKLDMRLLELGIPVLAMGECAAHINATLGGAEGPSQVLKDAIRITYDANTPLLHGLEAADRWFERLGELQLAEGLDPIARTPEGQEVGFADEDRRLYGLQFLIERNDPDGMAILQNFARDICHCTSWWTMQAVIDRVVMEIRENSGEGRVLCLVSGGLDSTVCARLALQAVGERALCVLVDTGMLRQGEAEEVLRLYREDLGIEARHVDAREETLRVLSGVESSAEKTLAVEMVYERAVNRIAEELGDVQLLVQGTNYSDLTRDGIPAEDTDLDACGRVRTFEPLRELFKEEVRQLGELLGLPAALLQRQSFPSAGLALRLTGAVDAQRIALLRRADAIVREEIEQSGQERRLSKYFALMMPMPTGQAQGDIIVVRAVQYSDQGAYAARLPYDLLERVVQRIRQELPQVLRVLYDVTDGAQEKVEWK